ncbi:MAG: hypothetical protein CM15mP85_17880 [Rhodobacterales bacterium]|nr:MAG: hypothetical protein CM15mP85_17880 [Rhodobacterales bacterium]
MTMRWPTGRDLDISPKGFRPNGFYFLTFSGIPLNLFWIVLEIFAPRIKSPPRFQPRFDLKKGGLFFSFSFWPPKNRYPEPVGPLHPKKPPSHKFFPIRAWQTFPKFPAGSQQKFLSSPTTLRTCKREFGFLFFIPFLFPAMNFKKRFCSPFFFQCSANSQTPLRSKPPFPVAMVGASPWGKRIFCALQKRVETEHFPVFLPLPTPQSNIKGPVPMVKLPSFILKF